MTAIATTLDTVRAILVNDIFVEIPAEQISPDDWLRDALGLDSVSFVELRVQCETAFGIEITEEDFAPENFGTVRQVVALVDRKVADRWPDP